MRFALLPIAALLACRPAPSADVQPEPVPVVDSATLAFEHVRVFDGEQWLDDVTVLVDGATIVAVGPNLPVPEGAERVPTEGRTLLPGLIDAHTHIQMPQQLTRALVFGVTTEIDMFTTAEVAAALRKPANDRAELVSSGVLATAPGGHGTEYGIEIPTVSRPEDAPAFVDARVAEGSEFLKIVYDDGKAYGASIPTVDAPTLKALVDAAHERDLLAVVHISAQEDAMTAIEAGADGLAHLFFDSPPSDAFIDTATEHGIFVTDTLAVLSSFCDGTRGAALVEDPRFVSLLLPAEQRALSKPFGASVKPSCKPAMDSAVRLHEAGVRILASTDAPNAGTIHGASLHDELALLVEAGLSPTAALHAATAEPAGVFGLEERGHVATGMQADLVLVEGDPSTDITTTRNIVGVWKAGHALDLEAKRAEAAKYRADVDEARQAPAPAGLGDGLIADFESGEVQAAFGAGWQGWTDKLRGGASTVELTVEEERGKGSFLRVTGSIDGDSLPAAWAGAAFLPGDYPMAPANLISKPNLSFRARGQGSMQVMIYARQLGFMPAMTSVPLAEEWTEHELDIRTLVAEPYDVVAIFFGGPPKAGPFAFELDDVRLR